MAKSPPSFTIKPLSKDEEFFKDVKTVFSLIEGSGQSVYWKNCYVLIFKTGETKTPIESREVCDGQAVIPEGLDVFFGGQNGKVKEVVRPPREEENDRVKCHVCGGTGYIEKEHEKSDNDDEECHDAAYGKDDETDDEVGGSEDIEAVDEKLDKKADKKEDQRGG